MDKKVRMPLPIGDKNVFDESTKSITTSDFFKLKPIYIKEVLPGEDVDIDVTSLTRLAALQKPMYGDVKINLKSFFVPMRVVFPRWNDFISNTNGDNSFVTHVPTFSNKSILEMMFQAHSPEFNAYVSGTSIPYVVSQWVTGEDLTSAATTSDHVLTTKYDFYLPIKRTDDSGNYHTYGFVFTALGRRFYDILLGLGYNINFLNFYDSNYTGKDQVYSAMPLMSYCKIYSDWFTNSQYGVTINTMQATLNTMANENAVTTAQLEVLANLITYVTYDRDMFVSAFDEPTSPSDSKGILEDLQFVDISYNAVAADAEQDSEPNVVSTSYLYSESSQTGGTPILGKNGYANDAPAAGITQYSLDCLRKLTNYVRRNQIAGVRALDRYYARYGYQLSSEKLMRSQLLESFNMSVDIADVMSTADTVSGANGMQLGSYAGQGIAGGDNMHIRYNSDGEFGFLIITMNVMPYIKYFEGLQPHCSHVYVSEFYQPEFDGLGADIIPQKYLFNNVILPSGLTFPTDVPGQVVPKVPQTEKQAISKYTPDGTYGFLPRYFDKKTNPYAIVSGDFRLESRNTGLDAWHLLRKVNTKFMDDTAWQHSETFTNGTADREQYDRIFQDATGYYDNFITVFNFRVKSYKPVKRMFDDWVLDENDSEHHREISVDNGGTSIR